MDNFLRLIKRAINFDKIVRAIDLVKILKYHAESMICIHKITHSILIWVVEDNMSINMNLKSILESNKLARSNFLDWVRNLKIIL